MQHVFACKVLCFLIFFFLCCLFYYLWSRGTQYIFNGVVYCVVPWNILRCHPWTLSKERKHASPLSGERIKKRWQQSITPQEKENGGPDGKSGHTWLPYNQGDLIIELEIRGQIKGQLKEDENLIIEKIKTNPNAFCYILPSPMQIHVGKWNIASASWKQDYQDSHKWS